MTTYPSYLLSRRPGTPPPPRMTMLHDPGYIYLYNLYKCLSYSQTKNQYL